MCVGLCVFQAADEPAYLTVGTDVSAKYRGAFCEAKIKTVKRMVKVKVRPAGTRLTCRLQVHVYTRVQLARMALERYHRDFREFLL